MAVLLENFCFLLSPSNKDDDVFPLANLKLVTLTLALDKIPFISTLWGAPPPTLDLVEALIGINLEPPGVCDCKFNSLVALSKKPSPSGYCSRILPTDFILFTDLPSKVLLITDPLPMLLSLMPPLVL